MRFSKIEIRDLVLAWLLISVAFGILYSEGLLDINKLLLSFVFSLLTVGISFLLHELMHKYLAQKYGLWAEFRASYSMLMFAVLMSFLGFILAAPGGVYIRGLLTREKEGKISFVGPLMNIILALIFLFLYLGFKGTFFVYGFRINALLGIFNMLPIPSFDGFKVYLWNKKIYFITLIFSGLLLFVTYVV
ncbi:MAG: site-2 protease family protein [archaeon]